MFKYIAILAVIPLACLGAAMIAPPSKAMMPRIMWYDVLNAPEVAAGGWANTIIIRAWSDGVIEARGVRWNAASNCIAPIDMCDDDWRIIND